MNNSIWNNAKSQQKQGECMAYSIRFVTSKNQKYKPNN